MEAKIICLDDVRSRRLDPNRDESEKYRTNNLSRARESWKASRARNRHKHLVKITARRALAYALEKGILEKSPCAVCGSIEVQSHHDDYAKPLQATWLCRQHYDTLHRILRLYSRGQVAV